MLCKNCSKYVNSKLQLCKTINFNENYFSICNNNSLAAKVIFTNTSNEIINCHFINNLKNVNFSKYITTIKKNNKFIIIYEKIDGIHLSKMVNNYTSYNFVKIIKKVVNQLFYLEKQKFYFLNLSLDNILLKLNNPYLINYSSLTNYKLNKFSKDKNYGQIGYCPPEYIINNNLVINKFDVFSIGIILFQKFYNFNPLSIEDYYYLDCWCWCNNKNHKSRELCLIKFLKYSKNIVDDYYKYIIIKCLQFDPDKRIDIKVLNQLFTYTV